MFHFIDAMNNSTRQFAISSYFVNLCTQLMTRVLNLLIWTLTSATVYGQGKTPSLQDSILLHKFWSELTTAVNTLDKSKLAGLCEFPFYCRPCIDDTTLRENNHVTIKVTRDLFYRSQYKLFFDKPFKDDVNNLSHFKPALFYPTYDAEKKQKGWGFSYPIIAPFKSFEGKQGWVYVDKIKGQYKITGMDVIP